MKLIKKNKSNLVKKSSKKREQLNELEKKTHNKPLNTGNHIEQKWFPRTK